MTRAEIRKKFDKLLPAYVKSNYPEIPINAITSYPKIPTDRHDEIKKGFARYLEDVVANRSPIVAKGGNLTGEQIEELNKLTPKEIEEVNKHKDTLLALWEWSELVQRKDAVARELDDLKKQIDKDVPKQLSALNPDGGAFDTLLDRLFGKAAASLHGFLQEQLGKGGRH